MKFLKFRILCAFFVPVFLSACTLVLRQDGQDFRIAKNLDWPAGSVLIFQNPDSSTKISMANALNCQGNSDNIKATVASNIWTSKYHSLTINAFGRNMPLSGINSRGLIIESLALAGSRFPENTSTLHLNEFEWIQYHLDQYESLDEVISSAKGIAPETWFIALHYLVHDANGNSAVIEWQDGKLIILQDDALPYPVLVNNFYSESLHYLSFHEGYGGNLQPHGGPESPERFVKAINMLRDTVETHDLKEIMQAIRQNDTQWSVIYDNIYMVKLYNYNESNKQLISIKFRLMNSPGYLISPYPDLNRSENLFSEWTADDEKLAVERFFNEMAEFGDFNINSLKEKLTERLKFLKISDRMTYD